MPFSHIDHEASAQEALDRGVISGRLEDLAAVPEPQQSSEHQARVSVLSILNELGGPGQIVATPWQPGLYPPAPPTIPDPEPEPEPEPEPGVPVFGSRPKASGPIRPSSSSVVENLHFNGRENDKFIYRPGKSSNSHVCILTNGRDITIRDCDFEDVSQPIAIIGGGKVTVENCRVKGIVGPSTRVHQQTGNFVQTVNKPDNVVIRNNVVIASTTFDPWNGQYKRLTEDIISLYSASGAIVEGNYLEATGYVSNSGTGIIAGDLYGDNAIIRNNVLINPGQVGLAVAGGSGHRVDGNIVYRDLGQHPGSGNTAAYCWDYNGNTPTNNVVFSNNRARFQGGNGFWNPGPPPATQINNNWNDSSLTFDDLGRAV